MNRQLPRQLLRRLALPLCALAALGATDAAFAGQTSLAGQRCPAGSVVSGFSDDGTLDCVALPSVECPAGQYLQSVDAATGAVTCGKLQDRFYTKRSGPLASVGQAQSPLLYTAGAECDAGDIVIAGGGRCAASDYGMTATYPALANGSLGSVGTLSQATGSVWRFYCSLQGAPGSTSFAYALCMKGN
jgi:hypothetical protein